MSEILKNIETCRGEDVLAEVSALPQDPHFGSLVNEAFDPMQQQALHQAGYDGYSEVIAQHKPYTFASAIIQMKSNLLLLLRALWQFPFGSGTLRSLSDDASLRSLADDTLLRSLSDMWSHYIHRLQGNETYGIPSRLSSLTDLPSAPLLVADRKISGVPDAEDGISLVQLCCKNSNITTLTDDTRGWTMNVSNFFERLRTMFPSVTTYHFGCSSITTRIESSGFNSSVVVYFDDCASIPDGSCFGNDRRNPSPNVEVHIYGLKTTNQPNTAPSSFYCGKVYLHDYEHGVYRHGGHADYANNTTEYYYIGCKGAKTDLIRVWSSGSNSVTTDVEIPSGACQSLTLQNLDGLTAENMYNHILCRLKQDEAGCGSGVTITLGSTNIAKLEAVEEYNTLLTELEDVYGYTFA